MIHDRFSVCSPEAAGIGVEKPTLLHFDDASVIVLGIDVRPLILCLLTWIDMPDVK